jgi:hypothetical protein
MNKAIRKLLKYFMKTDIIHFRQYQEISQKIILKSAGPFLTMYVPYSTASVHDLMAGGLVERSLRESGP